MRNSNEDILKDVEIMSLDLSKMDFENNVYIIIVPDQKASNIQVISSAFTEALRRHPLISDVQNLPILFIQRSLWGQLMVFGRDALKDKLDEVRFNANQIQTLLDSLEQTKQEK